MLAYFQKTFKEMLKILFPPLCVACRRKIMSGVLCSDCGNSIEVRSGFICPKCNRRLPIPGNPCHPKENFILAAAAFYENRAVRELIHVLKYQNMRTALEPLAEIVNAYLQKLISNWSLVISNSVIIPIPIHPKKEKERGFNQAALIAEALAEVLRLNVVPALIKTRNVKSQTEAKNYEERTANVLNCFALEFPESVAGKNIILVDDVFTSGATMREAVRVLKQVGARKIIGFVIAKA